MSASNKFSVLRDPVHGDVYLSHEELAVLDTREMQRLRGIKQLGTAYLVYPGAVHTRFDHLIGALHVTGKVIDSVNKNAELDPSGCLAIGESEARIIRLAALIHDAGHDGHGNAFHISSESEFALMYSDQSPLEARPAAEPCHRRAVPPLSRVTTV